MRKEFNNLIYEEVDDIAYISINTPPANKMTPEFLFELKEIILSYVMKDNRKGVILSGVGRHFSSGANIDKLLNYVMDTSHTLEGETPDWMNQVKDAVLELHTADFPVVSAVSGCCIGSGFELALSSHLCVVEKGTMLGFPEVTFGLLPGMAGTLYSVECLGRRKAFEYILGGEITIVSEKADSPFVDLVVKRKTSKVAAEKIVTIWAEHGGPNKMSKEDILKLMQAEEYVLRD